MGRGRGGIRRKSSNKGKEEVAVGNRKNKGKGTCVEKNGNIRL